MAIAKKELNGGVGLASTEELKEKFARVQEQNQHLREERIRLESEVKTLEADYQKKLSELLEVTNTKSYEEAVLFCKEKRRQLEEETERLDKELEQYLHPQQKGLNEG